MSATTCRLGSIPWLRRRREFPARASWGITWWLAAKWASRTIARWKMARLQERKRVFPPARPFAADRRFGELRRDHSPSSKKRMLGLRGCQNLERESENWKRRLKI